MNLQAAFLFWKISMQKLETLHKISTNEEYSWNGYIPKIKWIGRQWKRFLIHKNEWIERNNTFKADLETTTSQGLCTHGSPSTWTGISELRWILMWPPWKQDIWSYSSSEIYLQVFLSFSSDTKVHEMSTFSKEYVD